MKAPYNYLSPHLDYSDTGKTPSIQMKRGCTRLVFVLKRVVIKIPNFTYSWQHFLKGLLGNIQESTTYKWHSENHLLCPVRWCSWGGWILIMDRADTEAFEHSVRHIYPSDMDIYKPWIDVGLGGDDKSDNYGILNGKVVKIDYAQ